MLPKNPEEHRCPACGNFIGQPQDSLRHNVPNSLDTKDQIERLRRLSGALELPFLDLIRETAHTATTFLWRPDNPGLHQDNLERALRNLARIKEAICRYDEGAIQKEKGATVVRDEG